MNYIVDTEFENFDTLKGDFILQGDDYSRLKSIQHRLGRRIIALRYMGPVKALGELPKCHLAVCLNGVKERELMGGLYRLTPKRVSFYLTESQDILAKARYLSPFPFELDLAQVIEALQPERLVKILNHYLHEPSNQLKIQPFHAILAALVRKKRFSLWDVLWADPEQWLHINKDKLVLPLADGAYKCIGRYCDDQIILAEPGQYLKRMRQFSFKEDDHCQKCPFFYLCQGCIRAVYSRCDNYLYIYNRLVEAACSLGLSSVAAAPINFG